MSSTESEGLTKHNLAANRDYDPAYGAGRPHDQSPTKWRADLCFPLVALYCLPCATADLMTRLGLGVFGRTNPHWCSSPWNFMLLLVALYILMDFIVVMIVPPECLQAQNRLQPDNADAVAANCDHSDLALISAMEWLTAFLYWFVFALIIMTRFHIRQRDRIETEYCPSGCPGGCEDVMCGCCCPCLTVVQMHRHVDDHHYCRELYHQQQTQTQSPKQPPSLQQRGSGGFEEPTSSAFPMTGAEEEETGKMLVEVEAKVV